MFRVIDHPDREAWGTPIVGGGSTYCSIKSVICVECEYIYAYMDVRYAYSKCPKCKGQLMEAPIGKKFVKEKEWFREGGEGLL